MGTVKKITAGTLALGWLLAAGAAGAAGLLSPEAGGSKEPIEITADRLISNNNEKWADFLGTVKTVQGKFSMTSDALRVYYSGDLMNPPKDQPMRSSVERFVAKGHVRIVTDQYTTDSQQAEYVQATDILTLTGPNSRVVSGGNTITGPKIVLQRAEGKAMVEGGGAERVRAVFSQESREKAADAAKEKGPATESKPAGKK
jgi:lipopolysaccharide transport protein LptA